MGPRLAVSPQQLRVLVPPLVATSYKGSSGKVGVVGGCFEYTGAPFYAALTALKLGADLSHVFCDEAAAVPIKSYSPELIVHGCLRGAPEVDLAEVARQADEVSKWFPALTARSVPRLNLTPDSIKSVPRQALVVGPGLGRDATMQAVAALLLERAVRASLPCVIDADGLRCVLERPSLVRGARWVVLTPNKPEYGRLAGALSGDAALDPADGDRALLAVAESFRDEGGAGPAIVQKGATDLLCDGTQLLECAEPGCLKRCGGQGDVLAGSIATLLGWAKAAERSGRLPAGGPPPPLLASYAGCLLTRRFAAAAFAKHRRSMTAPDLIDAIGAVFEDFSPASPGEPGFTPCQ